MTGPVGRHAGDAHGLPAYASFGKHRFPVEVIVVWRLAGGWHLSTLLYRGPDGPVNVHSLSTETFGDPGTTEPEQEWAYLEERLHEGRGGNGYTYEVEGFEVAEVVDIDPVVTARAAEVVAATLGPMGEIAGTMIVDQPRNAPVTAIPFVALTDDAGHRFLVATQHLDSDWPCEVRTEGGEPVDPVTLSLSSSGSALVPAAGQCTRRLRTW